MPQTVDVGDFVTFAVDPDAAFLALGWRWYRAGYSPYWLAIDDGRVAQVVEQYLS